MTVDQAFRKARSAAANGDSGEAERLLRDVLERFPGNKTARIELEALLAPKIENPPQETMKSLVALYSQGQWQQGADLAETLVQRFPHGEVLHNVAGALYARLGRFERAVELYDVAVALAPDYFEAFNNRGNALRELGRPEEALVSFDTAVQLNQAYADAHMNRGIALAALKRHDDALVSYGIAIQLTPGSAPAYNNRGNSLQALNRPDDALADFDMAIRLNPAFADAFVNRGNTLKALNRLEDALASYDQALALQPGSAEGWNNRGVTLKFLKRPDEARQSFEKALAIKPGYAMALAETLYMKAHLCDWTGISQGETLSQLALAGQVVPPFYMLPIDDDPARQLIYARRWAKERYGAGRVAAFKSRASGSRIKVGYFSADFHNHATMCLMIRLLELHDKGRFEIHAFSYGPDHDDPMRKRILAAVDGFHQVAKLSDAQIADLSRAQGIDIAIDLKGFTETSRSGIFSHRPAPVAVNYLGFPSTMGADFIDYIIADRVIVPEADQRFYAEKIAYLPNSYQVNDRDRAISDKTFTRTELGLPEDGFVFCSFNNNYKITPAEFYIWMRLLGRMPGSVLWLLQDNEWAAANLRREAAARGIDPARLIFAERAPNAEHLARQRCADLFLDTFKVNAHTTASDALWAGLPIVTKLGKSFVARVAGSLLHAAGLPELVTETDEAYEALALALATDPAKLAAIREKLSTNRLMTPLFDTERYTRDFEALLESMITANPR
jgi:predicted O-linked N-acetylglucosamine transferase (SPINDLY family)